MVKWRARCARTVRDRQIDSDHVATRRDPRPQGLDLLTRIASRDLQFRSGSEEAAGHATVTVTTTMLYAYVLKLGGGTLRSPTDATVWPA